MENTVQSNIAAWNAAFAEYAVTARKTPQEMLEKNLDFLGVALWKGFSAHQFGGKPKQKGIGMLELAFRTASHQGTRVRATLMAEYMANRAIIRAKAKAIKQSLRSFGGTLDQWVGMSSALAANREERISLWQSIVGREVKARQAGIGELGAAFLWYRNRGKGAAKRLVLNRTGKPLGSVEVGEGAAVILGEVAGLTTVDARYSIVAAALDSESAKMLLWAKENQDEKNAAMARGLLG